MLEVDTVSTEVAALPLVISEDGLKEQTGAGVRPPLMLQESMTVPA
jgi:hypothetical protein